jgi:hypothetical protein
MLLFSNPFRSIPKVQPKRTPERGRRNAQGREPERKWNPTGTTWALIAAGSAALLGIGIAGASLARRKKPTGPTGPTDPTGPVLPCDPTPYTVEIAELEAYIDDQIDKGEIDKATVAQNTADEFFGLYPTGQVITFPPAPNAPVGVSCVWQIVIVVIDDVFKRRNVPDMPDEPPLGSLDWVLHASSDPGYPWAEPTLHVNNFPTPGMWVDIGNKDGEWNPASGFDSLVRAALGSALAMAGGDVNLASDNSTRAKSLRAGLRNAITYVGGVNDRTYGQTNANFAGGVAPNKPCVGASATCVNGKRSANATPVTYMMNAEDRGLNWLPRHADNISRIPQGLPLKRTTKLDGGKLGNGGTQQMLLWIPALDLDALAAPVPTIRFLKWADGSSTLNPPPQIQALGVDESGVNLSGVV